VGGRPQPQRVRQRHVDWLAERLTDRDRDILEKTSLVRLLTSSHIERLAFHSPTGRSRAVVRSRVLKRLVDWRVLTPLARRIGGMAHGSSESVYALDSAGHALMQLRAIQQSGGQRLRRPSLPGERFVRHALTVSELYVQLVEALRGSGVRPVDFRSEPDAWIPDGLRGFLKADAYVVIGVGDVEDAWAIEVDKSTEHLPTIKRKVEVYLEFMKRGQVGFHEVMPRVLVTVPDYRRLEAVLSVIQRLPEPATTLFHVTTEGEAVAHLFEVLRE
jgi:hypothetical protein